MDRIAAKRRRETLKKARDLARTGHFPDHVAVVAALETAGLVEGAGTWLNDERFLAQLDATCRLSAPKPLRP